MTIQVTSSKPAMIQSASVLRPPMGCAWHLVQPGIPQRDIVKGPWMRRDRSLWFLCPMLFLHKVLSLWFCKRNLVLPVFSRPVTSTFGADASANDSSELLSRPGRQGLSGPRSPSASQVRSHTTAHIYSRLFGPYLSIFFLQEPANGYDYYTCPRTHVIPASHPPQAVAESPLPDLASKRYE